MASLNSGLVSRRYRVPASDTEDAVDAPWMQDSDDDQRMEENGADDFASRFHAAPPKNTGKVVPMPRRRAAPPKNRRNRKRQRKTLRLTWQDHFRLCDLAEQSGQSQQWLMERAVSNLLRGYVTY